MFTDMVGCSRQMGAEEARMLRLLDVHNEVVQRAVAASWKCGGSRRPTKIRRCYSVFLPPYAKQD
jgi:hypothetical protein